MCIVSHPIEKREVEEGLREAYGRLYVADEKEEFFRKTLAVVGIEIATGGDRDKIVEKIVHTGEDKGISALYADFGEKILYIVKSRWVYLGKAITGPDMQTLSSDVDMLVRGDFLAASAEIKDAVDRNFKRILLFVHTGDSWMGKRAKVYFNALDVGEKREITLSYISKHLKVWIWRE